LIFSIIITNKNKTAIAPIYTMKISKDKNSTPIIINKTDEIAKVKTRFNSDCTGFDENNTIIPLKKQQKNNIYSIIFNILILKITN